MTTSPGRAFVKVCPLRHFSSREAVLKSSRSVAHPASSQALPATMVIKLQVVRRMGCSRGVVQHKAGKQFGILAGQWRSGSDSFPSRIEAADQDGLVRGPCRKVGREIQGIAQAVNSAGFPPNILNLKNFAIINDNPLRRGHSICAGICDGVAIRNQWIEVVNQQRQEYEKLKKELLVDPRNTQDSHPLALEEDSSWTQFFKLQEMEREISQDTLRTYVDLEYFASERLKGNFCRLFGFYSQDRLLL